MIKTRYEALRILGLEGDVTKEQWKSAYRNIIKKCHPDNLPVDMSVSDKEKAALYCRCAKEAYDFLEAEVSVVIENTRSNVSGGRIIGAPMPLDSHEDNGTKVKSKKISKEDAQKEKYKKLQEKGRELRRQEKERQILEEIRWLRVAKIIKEVIESDSERAQKEEKLSEAIKKAIDNN